MPWPAKLKQQEVALMYAHTGSTGSQAGFARQPQDVPDGTLDHSFETRAPQQGLEPMMVVFSTLVWKAFTFHSHHQRVCSTAIAGKCPAKLHWAEGGD